MSKMIINLNDEQERRVKDLYRHPEKETLNEFLERVVNRGLSALEYQSDSYQKSKDERKDAKAALKFVKSSPELMVKAGLAHKGDGSTGIREVKRS